MRKYSAIFGAAFALMLAWNSATADVIHVDKGKPGFVALHGMFDAVQLDMLPADPNGDGIAVAATDATYALNEAVKHAGVALPFRDFRTIADSGGIVLI